ncbi:ABC transporter permease subunit [Nocardioides taihuensis]|uniref:ABC transporter permease subunit n=1 Tax=Nocardioides taihuensis TaxID=1835606 RepID=A0ABW0BJR7_9ACTN
MAGLTQSAPPPTADAGARPTSRRRTAAPLLLRSVYLKTMRDQRRSLIGWSIGIALIVLVEAAVWPSFKDMPAMDDLMSQYPDYMKDLFDIESMTSGLGFMNAELFTLLLPALFIIHGIGRGARMIAGEEEAGTLDVLLVTPVSTTRLVLSKALALITASTVLGLVLWLVTLACSLVIGMGIDAGEAATGVLAQVLLGVEFGVLALAAGAATGRRSLAVGIPAALAVAAYVLHAVSLLIPEVDPWQELSPIHQALADGPLGAGLPASYLWLVLGTLVVLVASLRLLDRRDIAAPG